MVSITVAPTGTSSAHQQEQLQVGILLESALDNITAFATGGQTNATPLRNEVNRITTAAQIGASVKLPASAPGMTVIVINHGANSIQVYGSGSDTVDDVAAATGIPQMINSVCLYVCTTAGAWYAEGVGCGYSGGLPTTNFTEGITATAAGTQANSVQLTTSINRITTVATLNDGILLPVSAPGVSITIINAGANGLKLFAVGTDTINGTAGATGIALAAGKTLTAYCTAAGAWHTMLSA